MSRGPIAVVIAGVMYLPLAAANAAAQTVTVTVTVPSPPSGGPLPRTGLSLGAELWTAAILIALGLALVILGRRAAGRDR